MSTLIYTTILLGTLLAGCGEASKCKTKKGELDRCLAEVAIMPKMGLPHTRPQLNSMCSAFKGGMACVDRYTSSCLNPVEHKNLETHLRGARSFLAFLCDDPVFQRDYLSHATCLRDVSDDWERCYVHFKQLVSLQYRVPNITEETRDHNICCIREGFLSCVYNVGYFRCEKHQAMFLKKVTATLSYNDVQEEKCRNVSLRVCSRAPSVVSASLVPVVALALFAWLSCDGWLSLSC